MSQPKHYNFNLWQPVVEHQRALPTCLKDKAELLVALFTDISSCCYKAKVYWNIEQESRLMTKFLSIWASIDACTACSDFSTQVAMIPIHLPILAQLLRKVSSINHVVHLLGCCFTPVMKSPHRNKVGFFTQRNLIHWCCWFFANHQYPNKTSTLMESLIYLFWKILPLEKP